MAGHRFFMNDPDNFVVEAAQGLALTNPDLVIHESPLFIRRRTILQDKVALVSGGGTGHEPLHAGFVGDGMLDAAVPGAVFASPTAIQVSAATKSVDAGAGVLHIVKNYTGDVLNFKIAAELAADEGVEVASVLVDDDVATDIEGSRVGRRGTGSTLIVEKVCGAAARRGDSLHDVAELGRKVVANSRSIALALDACTHPMTGKKSFELDTGEVEFGVGIHGERGRGRIVFDTADALTDELLDALVPAMNIGSDSQVIAFVNGLGATQLTEQYVVTRAVHDSLQKRGIKVSRFLTGSYVTALNMSGISITLTNADKELLDLWDAPVSTSSLRW